MGNSVALLDYEVSRREDLDGQIEKLAFMARRVHLGSAARDSTTSTNSRTTSWRFGWTCFPVSQICSFGSRALA